MATPKNREIKNVAIVGTGVIGASWAALYLARGLSVIATDPGPNAEANLRRYIDAAWKDLTVLGISPNGSRDNLRFTLDMKEAVANADLIQENGPERPEFKIKLFADMDAVTPIDSLIASSSSGITMDVMQSACVHPERCVVGHPFNPPHVVPLVEVVGGAKTSKEALAQAMSFYEAIGKKPILLRKALPGHVANRLQAALYREVAYLVQEDVLSVEDADAAHEGERAGGTDGRGAGRAHRDVGVLRRRQLVEAHEVGEVAEEPGLHRFAEHGAGREQQSGSGQPDGAGHVAGIGVAGAGARAADRAAAGGGDRRLREPSAATGDGL